MEAVLWVAVCVLAVVAVVLLHFALVWLNELSVLQAQNMRLLDARGSISGEPPPSVPPAAYESPNSDKDWPL